MNPFINRIMKHLPATAIYTDFVTTIEEAMSELHKRGWSIGHAGIDGNHQVTGLKEEVRIIAEAPTELDAWLLACVKANEQERLWLHRN